MDVVNVMANAQAVNEKVATKPLAKATDKNALPAFDKDKGKQESKFDDVLKNIVAQEDVSDEPKQEEELSNLNLAAFINPTTFVEIASLSQATTNDITLRGSVMSDASDLDAMFKAADASGKSDLVAMLKVVDAAGKSDLATMLKVADTASENGKVVIPETLFTEAAPTTNFGGELKNLLKESVKAVIDQPQIRAAVQQQGNTASQDLLNMLTGKTAGASWHSFNAANTATPTDKLQQLQAVPVGNDAVQEETVAALPISTGTEEKNNNAGTRDNSPQGQEQKRTLIGLLSEQDAKELAKDVSKEPKITVADVLKEQNLVLTEKENVAKSSVLTMPEQMSKGQEQAKTNVPEFVSNLMEVRTTPTQQAIAKPAENVPEAMTKYNIPDQIIEQAKLIKTNEDTQMIIKLRPEHLGELTLKVTVEHGVVNATFHSDNANVRSTIEASLLQLRQELTAQGIKVDNVGVYAGLGDLLSNGQNQAQSEQRGSKSKNKKIDLADFEDEADKEKVISQGLNNALNDGVDYRI